MDNNVLEEELKVGRRQGECVCECYTDRLTLVAVTQEETGPIGIVKWNCEELPFLNMEQ